MPVTVTEATRQRLARSKAVFGGPERDLSILDQLAIPKNFDDLIMQTQAQDCNMFFPMIGLPRAYMEIPVWDGSYVSNGMGGEEPNYHVERWVYKVFVWWASGTRSKCEALLCEAAWKDFVQLRKDFAKLYGDASPLIVIRRQPEFDQGRGPTRCRINMRFAIPGIDLSKYQHCWDERSDQFESRYSVAREPIK